MIVRTGNSAIIAMVTTFLATLFLPIAAAVGIGVALSLLLQLNREALDLRVVSLMPREDARFTEERVPASLAGHEVLLLDVYGSLYYAGARTLAARLPDPQGAEAPVVVLRLRGRTTLGATSFKMLTDYAGTLEAAGGRLFLSGVAPALLERFTRTGGAGAKHIHVFPATDVIGESSAEAYRLAAEWREASVAGEGARDAGREPSEPSSERD
jgi:sulfate permease, SulP family